MNPTTPSASGRLRSDRGRARFRGSGSKCWRAILLFKSIPNFFESGAGATIIQFSARGTGGPDRPNSFVCEFDDNAAAKEHDMRQLGKRAIESSPLARSASARVSFLNEAAV